MPDGFHIAEAYVTVSPDTDGFYEKLQGDLERYDVKLSVPVAPDFDGFEEKLQAGVDARHSDVSVPVDPDLDDFEEKLKAGVEASRTEANVPVDPDTADFAAKLQAAIDTGEAATRGVQVPLDPDMAAFDAKLEEAITQARVFVTSSGGVTIPVSYDVREGSFARVLATSQLLADETNGAASGMTNLAAATNAAGNAAQKTYTWWNLSGSAIHWIISGSAELLAVLGPATVAAGAWAFAWVQGAVNVYQHLDALFSATEALGQSAGQTYGELLGLHGIWQQIQNEANPDVYAALGGALNVLKESFGGLAQVGLQVGQVFDTFMAKLVYDFSAAGQAGSTMGDLLSHMESDLIGVGQFFGNLGAALGSFASQMPGLAEVLLHFLDILTEGLKDIIGFAGEFRVAGWSILTVAMAFEEFNRWGSLAVTVMGKMGLATTEVSGGFFSLERAGGVFVNLFGMIPNLIGSASMALGTLVGRLAGVMPGAENAWTAMVKFGAALKLGVTDINPLTAAVLVLGTAALAFLIDKLVTAKTYAQQFADSLQQLAQKANDMDVFTVIAENMNKLQVAEQQATQALSQQQAQMGQAAGTTEMYWKGIASANAQLQNTKSSIAAYNAGMVQQVEDAGHVVTGAQQIAAAYHMTIPQAMAAAQGAGVSLTNAVKNQAGQWTVAGEKVRDYITGIQAMGVPMGAVGNDMLALAISSGEAGTKMSDVNQAWDSFMQTITGGTNDLGALSESMQNLGLVAASSSANLATAGSFTEKSMSAFADSLQSFSGKGAQAWQNFDQVVGTTAPQLIDWLRTAGTMGTVSGKQVEQAGLDMVAGLAPLAAKSSAARTELIGLAQDAGANVQTWPQLESLLKSSGATMGGLGKIVQDTTGKLGNMAAIAEQLGNVMNTAMTSAMSSAALKASGFNQASENLTSALQHNSASSPAVQQAAQKLTADWNKAQNMAGTLASQSTKAQDAINRLHGKAVDITGVNTVKALDLEVKRLQADIEALHGKTIAIGITESVQVTGGRIEAGGAYTGGAAGGAVLPGYAPGHDSMLVRASPGESIMVPEWTKAVGPANVMKMNQMFSRGRRSSAGSYAGGGVTTTTGLPEEIFSVNVDVPIHNIGIGTGGGSSGPAAVARSMVTVSQNLSATVSKINSEISAMKSYAKNIASTLAQSTGLGAITAPTNATTGAAEPVTGAYIKAQLQSQLATLKKFFAAIGKLEKDKLGKTLIGQVIALGPTEGLVYADAILAGGSKLAKQLRSIESQIGTEESDIGKRAADIQYGQNISKGFLSGLEKDKAKLKKEMKDGGKALADEVRKDLARLHIKADVSASEYKTKSGKVEVSINVKDPKGKFSAEEQAAIKRLIAQAIAAA